MRGSPFQAHAPSTQASASYADADRRDHASRSVAALEYGCAAVEGMASAPCSPDQVVMGQGNNGSEYGPSSEHSRCQQERRRGKSSRQRIGARETGTWGTSQEGCSRRRGWRRAVANNSGKGESPPIHPARALAVPCRLRLLYSAGSPTNGIPGVVRKVEGNTGWCQRQQ